MKEKTKIKKRIIIDDVGISLRGEFIGSEIVAYLIQALCTAWVKEVGNIECTTAVEGIIAALRDAEIAYKVNALCDMLNIADDDDDDDDEEDFDDDDT